MVVEVAAAPAPPAAAEAGAGHDAPWGRVDAEGNVFARTADGEVPIGSFQAGSPTEALAYYTRKFEALETEVALLEHRAAAPEVSPDESLATLKRLREALAAPTGLGDLAALQARLEVLVPVIDARRAQARAAREAAKAEARAERERIVSEAESLADSVHWKVAGERLRTLLDEWKAAPHVDRSVEQALWKRFGAARNSFDRRRRHHFAQLAASQGEVKAVKLKLIAEAETLSTSTDWAPTAARLRQLMDEWKAAGRVGRAEEESLWKRFRAAQDAFFSARSAQFTERDAGLAANLVVKESLCAEAEALLPVKDAKDLAGAKAALRSISERWEAAGHVPRQDKERVEARLRKVEDAVRKAEETRWQRTNPEGRARAQAAVDQLKAAIVKHESDLAKAQAKGDAKAVSAAEEAVAARRLWLEGAEGVLAEFATD